MKKARLRALTPIRLNNVYYQIHRRNEESTTEGIDTDSLP